MRLIVGLGNPGDRYACTRHNVGYRALEHAAERWSVTLHESGSARQGRGMVGTVPVTLAEPLTWMNQTGPVVKALLEALSLSPDALTIIHDDMDLDLGRLRFKRVGGHGGHNGVLSIIDALGTDQFFRLKIGIGRPAPGEDPAEFVLSPFSPDENRQIDQDMERAVDALGCLVKEGLNTAMNRFHMKEPEGPEADERDQQEPS